MDVIVGAALIVLLATLFALAVRQYATARYENDLRQRLRYTAETELNRLRAGIVDMPACDTTRETLRDDASLTLSSRAGAGEWSGFALVRVEAARPSKHGKITRVQLASYLPLRESTDAQDSAPDSARGSASENVEVRP